MIVRSLVSLLGLLLLLPVLALIVLAFVLPVTISGAGYLAGCALVVAGLISAPWAARYSPTLVTAGILLVVFVASIRLTLTGRGEESGLRVLTLPEGKQTRWLSTLIDEQDALIFGEALFHRIGGDTAAEHEGLTSALQSAYTDLRVAHGIVPSPVLPTYLGLQGPNAFDTVLIEPEPGRQADTAVIFLHGFMGNVTAQCWVIAQAAGKIGAVTACPSTEWTGGWWHPEAEAILASTFQVLREHGVKSFYLGGFSNGGFGISRLVSTVSAANGLRGLFFINGIQGGAAIRDTGLPVLIIQGAQDNRVRAAMVRQTAKDVGGQATYVELEGDHFMIIKQPRLVQDALTAWLQKQERDK